MPSAVIKAGRGAARAVELSKSNESGAIRQGSLRDSSATQDPWTSPTPSFAQSTRQWSSQQIPVYQKKTAAIKDLRLNCRDENGLALATKDDAAEMRWCEISGSILNLEFCATRWPETQWN